MEKKPTIDAHDFGAVLCIDDDKAPFDIWLEMTGRNQPAEDLFDAGPYDPARWGKYLEPGLVEAFTLAAGCSIHAEHSIAAFPACRVECRIDYRVTARPREVVETRCKIPGIWTAAGWGQPGTDQVPPALLAQCHGMMWIDAGIDVVHLPRVLGDQFSIYQVNRDARWCDLLQERIEILWGYIDADLPPDVDFAHRSTIATFKALYPNITAAVKEWGPAEQALSDACQPLIERRRDLTRAINAIRGELLERIQDAAWGLLPDGGGWRRELATYDHDGTPIGFKHVKRVPKGIST